MKEYLVLSSFCTEGPEGALNEERPLAPFFIRNFNIECLLVVRLKCEGLMTRPFASYRGDTICGDLRARSLS